MKLRESIIIFGVFILLMNCFSHKEIVFIHEHSDEITNYIYSDIYDEKIQKYCFEDKIILVHLRFDQNNSTTSLKKLFEDNENGSLILDITVYAKEKLEENIISLCEISLGDYNLEYTNELGNVNLRTFDNKYFPFVENHFSVIKKVNFKKFYKRVRDNNISFALVKLQLIFSENNDIAKWENISKLNINRF